MDRDEIGSRLGRARSATLGTVDGHGRPHLVPIVFAYEDERLYTAVDLKPKSTFRLKRLRNIEGNPNVCVLVDHYDEDWSRLWWVRLDGTARVVRSGAALRKGSRPAHRQVRGVHDPATPGPGNRRAGGECPLLVGYMSARGAAEREHAMRGWREHVARRPETDLGVDAATLIAQEGSHRAGEIGSRHPLGHDSRGDRIGVGEAAGLR